MSRNGILIVVLAVLGVSLLSAVYYTSISETFIFTEYLRVEEFKQEEDFSLAADVVDAGVRVANIYIRAERPAPQTLDIPVLVSIWHTEETELDSLYLKFSGQDFMQVYLEVPGGSWPPIRFHRSSDGKGAVFEVEDLGLQGTGTVTLEFRLRPISVQQSFYFEAKFSMHEESFLQLTRKEASTFTEIPIPT